MAGNDYNNIFSGDYWSQEGYKKRKAGEREASKKLATTQHQNNVDVWGNIGKALGGINKPIGDFFNGLPANQRKAANATKAATKKPSRPGAGLDVSASRTKPTAVSSVQPTGNKRNILPPGWQSQMQQPEDTQQSLFDELLGKITSEWSGPDKSKIDYSPLDAALNARLGALNGLRDKSQQNFDTSDANLESMHRGFQDHINTVGAGNYNKIADTQKQNLTASNDIAQNNLQKYKADDMAKREAMLKNLGIQSAGAAPDTSADVLNQNIASIESREQADLANADQDRATNLAYNQGIATSVGQAGVERRGDLAQQLQSIFGKIDMASADAQAENAQQRYQLEQSAGDKQYDQWRDQKGFLGDTLGMLQNDALEREKLASQGQDPQEIGGFAGIGQDLLNSGYEVPDVQNAMSALSEITAGDYMKGIDPNAGYNQVSVINRRLQQNGIPPMLAIQLATNYANLGNTSKYTDMPY